MLNWEGRLWFSQCWFYAAGCGGIFTTPNGTFTSPRHPLNYPHGANCTWIITVASGHVIRLSFNLFVLERHTNCSMDYVEIFDGYATTSEKSLGRWWQCYVSYCTDSCSSNNWCPFVQYEQFAIMTTYRCLLWRLRTASFSCFFWQSKT